MCKRLAAIFIVSLSFLLLMTACGGSNGTTVVVDPPPDTTTGFANANLNGTYILDAAGADFVGNMVIAAQFTANGQGQLINGTIITNTQGNGSQLLDTTFTGSYSVNPDGRGSATLNLAGGGPIKLQFAISAGAITLIRFDNLGVLKGEIVKQSAAPTSANGKFVYNLDGLQFNNGQMFEQHSAGVLTINNSEAYTARDLVSSGVGVQEDFLSDEIGTFNLANGIGTVAMTGASTGLRFRMFFVSADQAVVIGDRQGSAMIGRAERQSSAGSTDANSILSGNYVFSIQGVDSGSAPGPWVSVGRITSDGNGNLVGTRDASGPTVSDTNASFSAAYSMIADGRGLMTIPGGPQLTMYAVSSDKILLVGKGLNTYAWGFMKKQSSSTFTNASLSGKYAIVIGGGPTFLGGLWIADGNGAVSGTVDVYKDSAIAAGQAITGTYQLDGNGRGTTTVAANSIGLGLKATFYAVSPNEVVAISTEPSMLTGKAYKQ